LLPKYRGFSPSVWAVRNGETYTGATLFKMSSGMDEGDILDQREVPILDHHYIDKVVDNVTKTYLLMIEKNFDNLTKGTFELIPQMHSEATYTCNLQPIDFHINWNQRASEIINLIRAYTYPYSHAFFFCDSKKVRVKKAFVVTDHVYVGIIPGRVVGIHHEVGVDIVCADHVIRVTEIIRDDDSVCSADQVVNKLSYTLT